MTPLEVAKEMYLLATEAEARGEPYVQISYRPATVKRVARFLAAGIILRTLLEQLCRQGITKAGWHTFFVDVTGACAVYDDEVSSGESLQPQLSTSTPSTTSGLLSDSGAGEDRIS